MEFFHNEMSNYASSRKTTAPIDVKELKLETIKIIKAKLHTLIQQRKNFVERYANKKLTSKEQEKVKNEFALMNTQISDMESVIAQKEIEIAVTTYLPKMSYKTDSTRLNGAGEAIEDKTGLHKNIDDATRLALFYEMKAAISATGLWDMSKLGLLGPIKLELQKFIDLIYIEISTRHSRAVNAISVHGKTAIADQIAKAYADDEYPEASISPQKSVNRIRGIRAETDADSLEEPGYGIRRLSSRHSLTSTAADPFGDAGSVAASRMSAAFRPGAIREEIVSALESDYNAQNQLLSNKISELEEFRTDALQIRRAAINLKMQLEGFSRGLSEGLNPATLNQKYVLQSIKDLMIFISRHAEVKNTAREYLSSSEEWYIDFHKKYKSHNLNAFEKRALKSQQDQYEVQTGDLEGHVENIENGYNEISKISRDVVKLYQDIYKIEPNYDLESDSESLTEVMPLETVSAGAGAIASEEGISSSAQEEFVVEELASVAEVEPDEVSLTSIKKSEQIERAEAKTTAPESEIKKFTQSMDLDFSALTARLRGIRETIHHFSPEKVKPVTPLTVREAKVGEGSGAKTISVAASAAEVSSVVLAPMPSSNKKLEGFPAESFMTPVRPIGSSSHRKVEEKPEPAAEPAMVPVVLQISGAAKDEPASEVKATSEAMPFQSYHSINTAASPANTAATPAPAKDSGERVRVKPVVDEAQSSGCCGCFGPSKPKAKEGLSEHLLSPSS
jgi:hypothetical protein